MRYEQHQRLFQAPDHLYPRDVTPDALTRMYPRAAHALSVWAREAWELRRDPREIFHASRPSWESFGRHAIEGLEFVGHMDIADRSANGLRRALLFDNQDVNNPSEFGSTLQRAFENPSLTDHNHEHSRRFERWLEAMLLNIGTLRHEDSVVQWIDSAFLAAYFHDSDQLLTLQRNIDEHRGTEGNLPVLKAKKAHSLAAAVMLLSLHKRYKVEGVLRTGEAWQISAGAAYMVLKHDIPEEIGDALRGRGSPYDQDASVTTLLHGKKLLQKFDANELDLTQITPSQLVELLRMVKSTHGFVDGSSSFGLHPLFEREYRAELMELENNHQSLFKHPLDDSNRKSLDYMTEVTVRADVLEMIAPPVESIFRTLNTQYSKSRAFFRPGDHAEAMDAIQNGSGNVEQPSDSDVRRILWEYAHMDQLSDESGIGTSRYITKVYKEHAVLGVLAFQHIGTRIMQGDMTDITKHYEDRMKEVGKKALEKAGYSQLSIAALFWKARTQGNDVITEAVKRKNNPLLQARYEAKIAQLQEEPQHIINFLKKGSQNHPEYAYNDIEQFTALCDHVLQGICERYQVSRRELIKFKKKIASGDFSSATPYRRYDSIAGPEHIRTLIKPIEVQSL